MSVEKCETCIHREECDDVCLGYIEDGEVSADRDEWREFMAEVDRDEKQIETI